MQVSFSASEARYYKQLEADTIRELAALQAEAAPSGGSAYINMLYLLLRMRQACNHPWLVRAHLSLH